MRKFFSLIAAVLFAGSMMATEVTFTKADFAGQGTANTGSEVSATKDGVTFTFSKGYCADESLRCYAHGALSITAEATIEKINFTTTGGKNGGLDAEVTVGATSYSVEDLASQARFTEIKVTLEDGAPVVTDTYTVAGNDAAIFGEAWNPALTANDMTLANGIYKWEKAELDLTAGDIEFKVVKNHSWDIAYPASNYVLNIAEDGEYTITITFDPTTETVAAEAVKKVIPQYEVAEAIAAGLTDNDEIFVRGIITKMEFKGANFAKFGSVNIYVADATDAEGEFEFFNCYSLNADTFRTSIPNYDPTDKNWAQFNEVADENGNTIHVGDTVIAFGKYKLYNSVHELNTGCYLVDIKHAPVAPAETITIDIESEVEYIDYVAAQGWWQFMAENDVYSISISNVSTTQAAGVYTVADLDADYTYIEIKATETEVHFVDGSLTLTEGEDGSRTIEGVMTGDDGNIYNIKLVFRIPTAETTVNVEIPEWAIANASEYYGFAGYILAGETADKNIYVQITIPGSSPLGQFTYADCYAGGTGIKIGDDYKSIYSMNFTVTAGGTAGAERAFVTADILCYNNTLYHVTTLVGEGINNVEDAVKAIKRIVNGQVVIEYSLMSTLLGEGT